MTHPSIHLHAQIRQVCNRSNALAMFVYDGSESDPEVVREMQKAVLSVTLQMTRLDSAL